MSFLNPLYHAVAWLLVGIHSGLRHVFGESAGWLVAVVALTVIMRLILYPIVVRQIHSQRAMQAIQPKMKELQAKHKNDKVKLNEEMTALWREHNVNPLAGCLPILLQIPIFISLFHTLREIKPLSKPAKACLDYATAHGVSQTKLSQLICDYPHTIAGFPRKDIFSAAHAKLFGVAPMPVSFKTSHQIMTALGGHQGPTRAICLVLTVIMAATTFVSQRQMMGRNAAGMDATQAQTQKIILYIFPLSFLIYGFFFPVGVLLYWLTSNLWAVVQQQLVIRKMDALPPVVPVTAAGPAPGAKPKVQPRGPAKPPAKPESSPAGETAPAKPARSTADVVLPPGGAISGPTGGMTRSAPANRPANRSNKKKRRGRR